MPESLAKAGMLPNPYGLKTRGNWKYKIKAYGNWKCKLKTRGNWKYKIKAYAIGNVS